MTKAAPPQRDSLSSIDSLNDSFYIGEFSTSTNVTGNRNSTETTSNVSTDRDKPDKVLVERNVTKKYGKAEAYDDSDSESSSDSDEETYRNIHRATQRSSASLKHKQTSSQEQIAAENNADPSSEALLTTSLALDDVNNQEEKKFISLESMEQPPDDAGRTTQLDVTDERRSSLRMSGSSADEWVIEDSQSVYSRDVTSSIMADDEVIAAMAVKPPREADDEMVTDYSQPISSCGTLDIALLYSLSEKRIQITIMAAKDLPAKDRGGAAIIQVRAVVLPTKRKRYKTKVQHHSSPSFSETFKLSHISPEDLIGLGIRFRLYGIGKVRDRLIGEATLRFKELNLIRDPQLTVTLQLEPRTDINRGDLDLSSPSHADPDASSTVALAHGGSLPEILLTLSYDEITGRLCVEVVKGSHFRNLAMAKPPDTHVKMVLLNSSYQEMSQSRTTVRRSQPNPVFKETFYFQVARFQLAEASLMVSVYCHKTIRRKVMLGWISMGRNSSSDMDEQHWVEMREAKGKPVSRWHTLVES